MVCEESLLGIMIWIIFNAGVEKLQRMRMRDKDLPEGTGRFHGGGGF